MSVSSLAHHDYTVGWICALPNPELVAALFMLDIEHPRLPRKQADTNNYTLGQIGQHNVAIACLPQGEYGLSSATNVASQMRMSFPNIQFGLMVGIAGGVPSLPDHDIRLGDVVVSKPGIGNGGVIQYDYGKALEGDVFESTGWLDAPPAIVRSAIGTLQARQMRWGNEFLKFLSVFEGNEIFKCPGSEHDHLYDAQDPTKVLSRPQRSENVVVHYGTIASGNALIKDAKKRDSLRAKHDILCFEMEAAGLMNSFPCAVIRGICDYSDTHKNKQWQPFAAATAAAYAKCLLGHIDPIKIDRPLGHDQKLLLEKQRRELIAWLSPLNFAQTQENILSKWQPGTGVWFLEDKRFQEWKEENKPLLWCTGIPGSGKSVLASVVVDHLRKTTEDQDVGIAVVFCSYEDKLEQTAVNLLASVLQQLIPVGKSMSKDLQNILKTHQNAGTHPNLADLSSMLQTQIATYGETYIVIDGLDECYWDDERGPIFLDEILKLLPDIHLMITSRPLASLEFELEDAVRLEISAREADVRAHLDRRLDENKRIASFVRKYPTLKTEIIDAVATKAQGMFLLARLHVDALATKHSVKDIRSTLQNLPRGLSDTYDEALSRIFEQQEDDAEFARKVLCWVTYAVRPLTMPELKHALAISPDDTEIDEEGCPEEEFILSLCAGLVLHEPRSGLIRLVHYTAQEHLEKTLVFRYPAVHEDITIACLTYISLEELSAGTCKTISEERLRAKKLILLDYACKHWGAHAKLGSISAYKDLAMGILQDESKLPSIAQAMILHGQASTPDMERFFYSVKGLHVAAHFGLTDIIEDFLSVGADIDLQDRSGQTALHRATRNGHVVAVKTLIKRGASLTSCDIMNRTPLHQAALKGNHELVQLLCSTDTIETKDHIGLTPLQLSAEAGSLVACQSLLKNGADISSSCVKGQTALHRAATQGHESIINFILDSRANTENKDKEGKTALISAATHGRLEVCRILLRRKADIQANTTSKRTALHEAARAGHSAVLELLVKLGAKLEYQDSRGRTPLLDAAESTPPSVALRSVKLLLGAGAASDAKDESGSTALILAIRQGRTAIVRSILDHSLDSLHSRNSDGVAPLSFAAARGKQEIANILLQKGARIDDTDDSSRTALHRAAQHGSLSTTRALLRAKADIHAKNMDGSTPLHISASYESEAVTADLIKKGASVHAKDNKGRTPMHCAAMDCEDTETLEILLDSGGKIDVKDNEGKTPMHYAAQEGLVDNIEFLSEKGLSVECRATNGETPLHLAASSNEIESIKTLVKLGADINTLDNINRRPVEAAITSPSGESTAEALKTLLELGANTTNPSDEHAAGGDTLLFTAVNFGKLDLVKILLDTGMDVNHTNFFGVTPIMCTQGTGNNHIFETLLSHGADIRCTTVDGSTLLHGAARTGRDGFVKFLVEAGLDVNSRDSLGRTPMDRAQEHHHHSTIELLQSLASEQTPEVKGPSVPGHEKCDEPFVVTVDTEFVEAQPVSANSLKQAVESGDLAKTENLLSQRRDLAKTPRLLNLAALRGSVELVRLLLDAGADCDEGSNTIATPLWSAFTSSHVSVAKLLVDNGADLSRKMNGFSYLHLVAERNHKGCMQYLLEQGADIEVKTNNGGTPVLSAATTGSCGTLRLLIEAKANLEAADEIGRTALHFAIINNKINAVSLLLASGANIEAKMDIGLTPLQCAARQGFPAIVQMLLENGAKITQAKEDGLSALHEAADLGFVEVAGILLDAGASIEAETKKGFTPLHCSILGEHDEVTSLLLDRGANIHCRSRKEETPLHKAAKKGNVNVVTRLLEMGAEVDASAFNENTALMFAIEGKHDDVARILLMRHARADIPGKDGFTAFHMACENGSLELARVMLYMGLDANTKTGTGATLLHVAAEYNQMEVAELLVDYRADIDGRCTRMIEGDTPLHFSAEYNAKEVTEFLIAQGADIENKNVDGDTPMHYAARYDSDATVTLLAKEGADINVPNVKGQTPLHRAAEYGMVKTTEILLTEGADIEARSTKGDTALILAAEYGEKKIINILLDHEANLSATNNKGNTPLHLAAEYGQTKTVKLLLYKGANLTARNDREESSLHLAAAYGKSSAVDTLIAAGADIECRDYNGHTPLLMAAEGAYLATVKRLITKHKADIEVTDDPGRTAIHLASNGGHWGTSKALIEAGLDPTVYDKFGRNWLHHSATSGSIKMVANVLEKYPEMNVPDVHGWMPIHFAAKNGNLEVVERLLQEGSVGTRDEGGGDGGEKGTLAVNWVTKDGWSPDGLAVFYGRGKLKGAFKKYAKLGCKRPDGVPEVGSKVKRVCDGCELWIYGTYYYCGVCADLDFCTTCYRSRDVVHPKHAFLRWDVGDVMRSTGD